MHRVLVGKPEGKKPLRRPRRRWVDNIRMDLQEVGCGYIIIIIIIIFIYCNWVVTRWQWLFYM